MRYKDIIFESETDNDSIKRAINMSISEWVINNAATSRSFDPKDYAAALKWLEHFFDSTSYNVLRHKLIKLYNLKPHVVKQFVYKSLKAWASF